MRLLSLNIENFGKLSDYQVDFSSNPAIFLEDNGWGKTTLATFIKVMFYGFAGGQKRGLENNERKRYMPWNKGAFGGSIRFEAGGIGVDFSVILPKQLQSFFIAYILHNRFPFG